jgi:hypothetical protein
MQHAYQKSENKNKKNIKNEILYFLQNGGSGAFLPPRSKINLFRIRD